MKKFLVLLLITIPSFFSLAQQTPTIGLSDEREIVYAFTNATIFIDYKTKIEKGTLLVKDGMITAVGTGISIPKGALVKDLNGKYIYPSFIDMYTSYGIPEVKTSPRAFVPEQFYSTLKKASNWNDAIHTTYNAVEEFSIDDRENKNFRKNGFGSVVSFKQDGIVRGSSALVSLIDKNENKAVLKSKIAAHYSFDKGSSKQNYPASLFGSIALLRQTYYDAKWYNSLNKKEYTDISLENWNQLQSFPQIFEVDDKLSLLRADKLGDEFNMQYIIKGNGDEYQLMDQVKGTNASLIMPVVFPAKHKIKGLYDAENISLKELKHWEMMPSVYAELEKQNIPFALTSYGLKDPSQFLPNIRKAIAYGLSEQTALKSLTYTPANLLKVDNMLGGLKKGMIANFIIASGNIFNEKTIVHENWIQGEKFVINDMDIVDYRGNYAIFIGEDKMELHISGTPSSLKFKIMQDTLEIKATGEIDNNVIHLSFKQESNSKGETRLSGWANSNTFEGTGSLADGEPVSWSAQYISPYDEKERKSKEKPAPEMGKILYPFIAHGYIDKPKQETFLIKNATVWTNEKEGIIEHCDVLVENGKIKEVGKNITKKSIQVIDGTGKHLTSGIIDEHSHIACSGNLNESSHAITSEVRVKDVLNPEDINIYRQLAGGVTASQILHGSANPIGGQSALIKLRWGVSPDELLINDGAQFLKHALGENVKQSRLPANMANRFPISRMGVEAIIRDAYQQALDYKKEWDAYKKLSPKEKQKAQMPRVDLRMEALADVLEHKSFMTCHTYVQSETNMIMKLAEDFGIKAHTLIHNTEGYKIADKIKAHGAYASDLGDWWSYKFEVYQAIPYNTAMQVKQGVTVAIHSDNAELARRLNQEAAKTIKYGGLTQEDAWKLITLNPAKILHLDHRMGSIKKGKDADLVLWSQNPLSMYAVVEKTMVDGIIYYDKTKDKEMQEWIHNEHNRLVNKMLMQE